MTYASGQLRRARAGGRFLWTSEIMAGGWATHGRRAQVPGRPGRLLRKCCGPVHTDCCPSTGMRLFLGSAVRACQGPGIPGISYRCLNIAGRGIATSCRRTTCRAQHATCSTWCTRDSSIPHLMPSLGTQWGARWARCRCTCCCAVHAALTACALPCPEHWRGFTFHSK